VVEVDARGSANGVPAAAGKATGEVAKPDGFVQPSRRTVAGLDHLKQTASLFVGNHHPTDTAHAARIAVLAADDLSDVGGGDGSVPS